MSCHRNDSGSRDQEAPLTTRRARCLPMVVGLCLMSGWSATHSRDVGSRSHQTLVGLASHRQKAETKNQNEKNSERTRESDPGRTPPGVCRCCVSHVYVIVDPDQHSVPEELLEGLFSRTHPNRTGNPECRISCSRRSGSWPVALKIRRLPGGFGFGAIEPELTPLLSERPRS